MREEVAYKRLKTLENLDKTVILKSSHASAKISPVGDYRYTYRYR